MLGNKAVAGIITGAVMVGLPVAVAQTTVVTRLVSPAPPVTVSKVVDGDTIDVVQDGTTTRVRLLNVDTPEANRANAIVQCLGPEATAFLKDLLPIGTEVKLTYDKERQDRYGRDLAAVFVGDEFISAEIARAGLGVAVQFSPNTRFYGAVQEAEAEAIAAGRGLHDAGVECSYPAQVQEFTQTAEQLAALPADTSLEALDSHLAEIAAAIGVGAALNALLGSDRSGFLEAAYGGNLVLAQNLQQGQAMLRVAREEAARERAAEAARERARIEAERLEAERLERERLEAERLEAERLERERLEEQRLEQERRAAEERAAEEQRRRAQASSSNKSRSNSQSGTSSSGSSGSSGGGSIDTYTGCRAYGGKYPPNAIDSKGRPYTKINCTTKMPRP